MTDKLSSLLFGIGANSRHCALIEVLTSVRRFQKNIADNCVCYKDGSSEHSRANWERGKVVFLALDKHYTTLI